MTKSGRIKVESIDQIKESDKTKLSRAYTFWVIMKKNRPPQHVAQNANEAESYESELKAVATVRTVEDFWAIYQHFKRPSTMSFGTSIHLVS